MPENRLVPSVGARFAATCFITGLFLLSLAALIKASLLNPLNWLGLSMVAIAIVLVWRGVGSIRALDLTSLISQHPDSTFGGSFVSTLVLTGLYLLGLFLWAALLGGGQVVFRIVDWRYYYQYLDLAQQAIQSGEVPYFASGLLSTLQHTNRLLAIPEVPLSPQMLLLGIMPVHAYVVVNTLLLYSVGYLGILRLWKRWQLSPLSFLWLWLTFNLNGYITSHVAVGHYAWVASFLTPILIDRVLTLLDSHGPAPAVHIGLLLWIAALQGGIHMMIWWLIFLGLVAIRQRQVLIPLVATMLIAVSLYAFRLMPIIATYGNYTPESFGGFRSTDQLLEGLVVMHDIYYWPSTNGLGWWEYDFYLGPIGFAMMVFFGIYLHAKQPMGITTLHKLNIPLILMAVLSIGPFYRVLTLLPIPLIASQRTTSRLFSVPFSFLLVMSAIYMQRWLGQRKPRSLTIALLTIAALVLGADLVQHLQMWAIPRLEMFYDDSHLPPLPVDLLSTAAATTESSQFYVWSVNISPFVFAASIVFAIAVMVALKHWWRPPAPQSPIPED